MAKQIFDTLKKEVAKELKIAGIKDQYVLPDETKDIVMEDAVGNVYDDVANLYDWYFDKTDHRTKFAHPASDAPEALVNAVRAVVKDDIAAMRDADEISGDVDEEAVTNDLVGYIVNWQDWYYDRKLVDDWTGYLEDQEDFNELYLESDYGNEKNVLGPIYNEEDFPYADVALPQTVTASATQIQLLSLTQENE